MPVEQLIIRRHEAYRPEDYADGRPVSTHHPVLWSVIAPKANCGMTSTRIAACLQNEEGFVRTEWIDGCRNADKSQARPILRLKPLSSAHVNKYGVLIV